MKIKDKNVKDILQSSIQTLITARKDTYFSEESSRQEISKVIGELSTLVSIIDFDETNIIEKNI